MVQVSEQVEVPITHLLPAPRRAAHALQTRRIAQSTKNGQRSTWRRHRAAKVPSFKAKD